MSHRTAILLIDVINDLEFPGAEKVLPWAQRMVQHLKPLLARARKNEIPIIYVNDNFNRWHANFAEIIRHATRPRARGRATTRTLLPKKSDFLLLKPKHSAFFATPLKQLLDYLHIRHLVLAGLATNLCVLFTAHDAHMHEYKITILSDCCAAESNEDHDTSLTQLKKFLNAQIQTADEFLPPRSRKKKPAARSSGPKTRNSKLHT